MFNDAEDGWNRRVREFLSDHGRQMELLCTAGVDTVVRGDGPDGPDAVIESDLPF